jgi:uncharacterized protein YacL
VFVEIVRLLIVALSTAAGYALAADGRVDPGGIAVLGATMGALVGYVAGGVVGRQLRRAMGTFEDQVARAPAHQLLAGIVGAGALAVVSALIALPAVVLVPSPWGWPVFGLLVWIGVYEGFQIGAAKSADLLELAGLRPQSMTGLGAGDAVLVDTSAVIDGRLLDVTEAGFLQGTLLVPRFVLDELQGIADAADDTRRRRGRRGLETLDVLRRDPRVTITVVDDEVPEFDAVDAKLVALARRLPADIVTTDANLQTVAEMQGVRCRNLNRLAAGLRPAIVPGDVLDLPISREGKEPGQGVGFLDDGTMVVVGDAAELVGRDVAVRITSNVQTSVGRLLFASVIDG